jgi:hypothetical protein
VSWFSKFIKGFSASGGSDTKTYDSTTTPQIPDWLQTTAFDLNNRLTSLGAVDPASYVASAHPLERQAEAALAGLTGQGPVYDEAMDLTRKVAGADWMDAYMSAPSPRVGPQSIAGASLLESLDSYVSPYLRQVISSTLADFDFGAGQTRAQQGLDLMRSGAFGGSGAALTRSLTEEGLARARAGTVAGLRDQAFTRAAGLSSEDASRRQDAQALNAQLAAQADQTNAELYLRDTAQKVSLGLEAGDQNLRAAGQLGDLATAGQTQVRANAAAMADLGGTLRSVETATRRAPLDLTSWQIDAFSGLNPGLFSGKTETGSSRGTTFNAGWKGSGS